MNRHTIHYMIGLEPEQVDRVARLLRSAGVEFDPTENMAALPPDNVAESVFLGRDGEWLQESLNEHLEGRGLRPMTRDFYRMSLEAQRDFLFLATLHCAWRGTEVRDLNEGEWNRFLEKHPEAAE